MEITERKRRERVYDIYRLSLNISFSVKDHFAFKLVPHFFGKERNKEEAVDLLLVSVSRETNTCS